MKALLTRTALATALLVTITGAQAASMDFEVSDSDTIVVGATAEKVTLRVTGYKNLAPNASAPANTKLGAFNMSTSSGVGTLAVTYGAEHKPISFASGASYVGGDITNGEGNVVATYLSGSSKGTAPFNSVTIGGTPWAVLKTPATSFEGGIYTEGVRKLSAGVYPITLRAALYQP